MFKPKLLAKLFLILTLFSTSNCQAWSWFGNSTPTPVFKLSLHPTATERLIENETEESLAFQICQALQAQLTAAHSQLQVTLTHEPGATYQHLQLASQVNQAAPQFFLSVHVYHEAGPKPAVQLYYYTRQRYCAPLPSANLSWLAYSDAYLASCDQTINWGHKITNYLQQNSSSRYLITPLQGCPFKPLAGIQVPALAVELGVKNQNWTTIIKPLTKAILECVTPII